MNPSHPIRGNRPKESTARNGITLGLRITLLDKKAKVWNNCKRRGKVVAERGRHPTANHERMLADQVPSGSLERPSDTWAIVQMHEACRDAPLGDSLTY